MSRDQDEILLGGVDSDLADRYRTAKQKVRERTGVSLSIAGGGRSRERQQKYFEEGKTPYDGSNPNAPHPLGLALDLNWKRLPGNIQSVAAEELRNVGLRQGGVLANGYSEKHHWQLPAVTDGNHVITGLDGGSSQTRQSAPPAPQTISDGNVEIDFSPQIDSAPAPGRRNEVTVPTNQTVDVSTLQAEKLKTPKVMSAVNENADFSDETGPIKDAKPIEFKPENPSLMQRAAMGGQALAGVPQLPANHPDSWGEQRTAVFQSPGRQPTQDQLADAMLQAIGPQAVEVGRRYKNETGRNILEPDVSQDKIRAYYDPASKAYKIPFNPTQKVIRTLNAYARGGLPEVEKEVGAMDAEGRNLTAQQEKERVQGEAAKWTNPDLSSAYVNAAAPSARRGVAEASLGSAKLINNLSGLVRDPNAAAEDALALQGAQASIPQEKQLAGKIVRGVTSGGMTVPRYIGEGVINLALPALDAYSSNLDRGPVAAATEGEKMALVGGVGHAAGGALEGANPLVRQVGARASAGLTNAGLAYSGGERDPGNLLAETIVGASLPVGKARGEEPFARPGLSSIADQMKAKGQAPLTPASEAQISPEPSLGADAAQGVPETTTEAEPHYSTNQNRRQRNTATGNKGQFKPGFKNENQAQPNEPQALESSKVSTPANLQSPGAVDLQSQGGAGLSEVGGASVPPRIEQPAGRRNLTPQEMFRAIDRSVFQDRVSQPVQRDGQRLIDAIRNGDAETMRALLDKYKRHMGAMEGGGGSGPGKEFRGDPAKATVGQIADLALRNLQSQGQESSTPAPSLSAQTQGEVSALVPSKPTPEIKAAYQQSNTQLKLSFGRESGTVSDADVKALFPEYKVTLRRTRPMAGGEQGVEVTFWDKKIARQVKPPADWQERLGLGAPLYRGQDAVMPGEQVAPSVRNVAPKGEVNAENIDVLRGGRDLGRTPDVVSVQGGGASNIPKVETRARRALPRSLEDAGLEGGQNRFYDVKSNVESENKARELIKEKGIDEAIKWVKHGSSPSAEQSATALELIKGLARDKSTLQKAVDVADDLAGKATEYGQAIQYYSTLAKETPEGALLAAQKIVGKRGGKLTQSDAESVTEIAKKLQDSEARITTLEQQIEELNKRPARRAPRLATFQERMSAVAEEAKARILERQARRESESASGVEYRHSGIPAIDSADLKDYAIVGAAKLAQKGARFAQWSGEMIKDFGEEIRPHLNNIFQESFKTLDGQRKAERQAQAERSAQRAGAKTPEDIRSLIISRRAEQARSRQARAELAREFARLQKGTARDVTERALGTLNRNSLLTPRGFERILAGMTGKQAADAVARVIESPIDALVSGVRHTPRTAGGLTVPGLTRAAIDGATSGARNAFRALRGKQTQFMEAEQPLTKVPVIDSALNSMQRLYSAKENALRSYAYNESLQRQARVLAVNDVKEGVIRRNELEARTKEYLNNPPPLGVLNSMIAAEKASTQADYEVRMKQITKGMSAERASQYKKNMSDLMDSIARRESDEQVYAEPSRIAESVRRATSSLGVPGKVAQGLYLPFMRRPSNSIVDFAQTYLGAPLNIPVQGLRLAFEKTFTAEAQARFAKAVSRGLVGYGVMGLGAYLGSKGMMHNGNLVIDNKEYPVWKIPFVGWLLGIGNVTFEKGLGAGAVQAGKEVVNHPLLRGLEGISEDVGAVTGAAKGNLKGLGRRATMRAGDWMSRLIPQPLPLAAETMDNKERVTNRDVLQKPASKIPFLRQRLTPYAGKSRWSIFDPFYQAPPQPKQGGRRSVR